MKYKIWINEWLNVYVKQSIKEKTYINYSTMIRVHIIPHLGEYELEDMTLPVLQNFVLELGKTGNSKTEKGLSASTISIIITLIQRSLRFAVEIGKVDVQYSDHIKRPKLNSREIDSFTVAEQKKIESCILQHPQSKEIGILLCLYTGLRIGELMALRWCDIDLNDCLIYVNGTCRDGFVDGKLTKVIDTPKTSSSKRMIPIPFQIVPYLVEVKKHSKSEYIIFGNNKLISVRAYQKRFTAILKKLNIEHRGFHALRHTFATRALECGMDVKTLSEILGHKNPNITLSRYAHSMMEHKIAMMNRVGLLL